MEEVVARTGPKDIEVLDTSEAPLQDVDERQNRRLLCAFQGDDALGAVNLLGTEVLIAHECEQSRLGAPFCTI